MEMDQAILLEFEQLRRTVSEHEKRLASLEAGAVSVAAPAPAAAGETPAWEEPMPEIGEFIGNVVGREWTQGLPARLGRLLVILGGAFMLRALTESETVGLKVGVGLGLTYALAWTALAERTARASRKADATFYGLATTIIAFPLLIEATARMKVFPPVPAAVAVLISGLVVLGVSWRHRLGALAWIATLGTMATGVALLFSTRSLPPFAAVLFVVAAISLAISFHREWYFLRWPAALVLDALAIIGTAVVGREDYAWLPRGQLALVQVLLTAMYLGILGVRTLVLGHPMREFGIVQSLLVLAVGFEGAQYVLRPDSPWAPVFPLWALVMSVGCYAVSFLYLERLPGQHVNFSWYITFGTILLVLSLAEMLPLPGAGLAWAAAAACAALLGRMPARAALRWSSALLGMAAAAGSGVAVGAGYAFVVSDVASWPRFGAVAWLATVLVLAAWAALRWREQPQDDTSDWTVSAMALLVVWALGLGAGIVTLAAPTVAAGGIGSLAVLRTAVLMAAALLLAVLWRLRSCAELRWMVFTVLGLAACKIALQDMPRGTPLTICFSLVLFGGGMIVAPRMVARGAPGPALEDTGDVDGDRTGKPSAP
jgi:hypothetical protein